MKTIVFFQIALRIIILFSIGMASTYIPEHLSGFFGDTQDGWGARHYWYNWMMFLLFLLSLANLIISIFKILKKNYDM